MQLRAYLPLLLCALTLTSYTYGAHSELAKASQSQHNEQHQPTPSLNWTSFKIIYAGVAMTLVGHAWYQANCWAESMICNGHLESCTGDETYKLQAQGLIRAGAGLAAAGAILLGSDLLTYVHDEEARKK